MKRFSLQNAKTAGAFRISSTDTNYFVLLFDAQSDKIENVFLVEIFTQGGATPPNEHATAHEFFYVLHGQGIAVCDGEETPVQKGDALLVKPGSTHVVRNTGDSKLYTLTVMTPNEGFAELIRAGIPVELDDEDKRILGAA
jgi:mannose-6-phosphate isomerase-like protein (cupin superfamily)